MSNPPMSNDAKARRSSRYTSVDASIEEGQQGPAEALGLPPAASLTPAVERLRTVLHDVSNEQVEISVQAIAQRLGDAAPRLRFASTVRLIVHGPHTRSPILWQTGGVAMDLDAWASDLAKTLPSELRAVQTGHPLSAPWTGTVVLDPWVAALLVHECIGHTSEADNYLDYALPHGLSLGHRWTHAALNVVDDPTEPQRIGSYGQDDEGRSARPTSVITDGLWTALLHDSKTAAALEIERSGNGRRVVGAAAVLPRMSVLTALPGDHDLARLIGGIEEGWYCRGSWGAGSFGRRFMLRPTHALRIRNGELHPECLRRFDLRGDKFTTIAAIDAVGDDTQRFDPAFGCDKNGQEDLPVSFGAPHLRLRGITLVPMRSSRSSA